jgi:hypothetical protein
LKLTNGFGVPQNVDITFKVGSSFKEGLTPNMRIFSVTQNAGITFRVGSSYKDA